MCLTTSKTEVDTDGRCPTGDNTSLDIDTNMTDNVDIHVRLQRQQNQNLYTSTTTIQVGTTVVLFMLYTPPQPQYHSKCSVQSEPFVASETKHG